MTRLGKEIGFDPDSFNGDTVLAEAYISRELVGFSLTALLNALSEQRLTDAQMTDLLLKVHKTVITGDPQPREELLSHWRETSAAITKAARNCNSPSDVPKAVKTVRRELGIN